MKCIVNKLFIDRIPCNKGKIPPPTTPIIKAPEALAV